MYETNLNFTMLRKYVHVLSERGCIIATNGRIYTTMKGIEFLEKYEELMGMWNFLEKEKTIDESSTKLETIYNSRFSRERDYFN